MSHLHSYSSIFNLGHAEVAELFDGPVVIQEKVDGSQFSFGVVNGELVCRSKNNVLVLDAPEKMFSKAVETCKRLFAEGRLVEGWTYRCEYLASPHHNTLTYGRVPKDFLILYDVDTSDQMYLVPTGVEDAAEALGLECVPCYFNGMWSIDTTSLENLKSFLEKDSILGGVKIEGVVIKNYLKYARDKKVLMGKLVREDFKEQNRIAFRVANPSAGDVIENIIATYKNEVRWRKAVQHLREAGKLEGSPKDIGLIMREIPADIRKECEEEIRKALWDWAWPKIERGIKVGAPEWYKEQLAQSQFKEGE